MTVTGILAKVSNIFYFCRMKLNKPLPRFLLDKFNIVGSMTFTVMFALVFLNLYVPFSTTSWFRMSDPVLFLDTVIFLMASLAFLIVSRVIMYKTKYLFKITVLQYILWCVAEVVLICLFYTAFTLYVSPVSVISPLKSFLQALLYGTISVLIPYVISAMYLSIIDKERTIRLMNYSNVTTDEPDGNGKGSDKFTIFDSNGSIKLSVSSENLFYIESDDNYVKVWYADSSGELQKYMVRCRLKTIEESFRGTSLVRCHRKYIVNTDKVKVLRKEGDSYYLDLADENIPPLPVTKTYEKAILSKF